MIPSSSIVPSRSVRGSSRSSGRASTSTNATPELLGVPVPAGTLMTAYLDAAHRDPDVFEDPDRFDVTRRLPQPQLIFGIGRHYCIGAALARMQIQEVLRAITLRWAATPRLGPGMSLKTAVGSCEVANLPVVFVSKELS